MAEVLTDKPSNSDEILDILSEDDDKVEEPKKEDDKKEAKAEEEEIELEDDKEDEEVEIKEDELVTPFKRKEILKKYPEIFKEFPYLEKAYYREQKFTEIFPTFDDAQEAVEKGETLDKFESHLMAGSTEEILKVVKEENPESFKRLIDNYITTLAKVDEGAYYHVIGNVVKNAIIGMANEGRKSKNEALESAAVILNQFIFGTEDIVPPTNLSRKEPDDELKREREDFQRERFETVRDDLNVKVSNVLKATIDTHIDPKESMTAYVKKTATREALESLETLLENDASLGKLLDKLWEKAFEDRFSATSLNKIRSAYLSKAKTVLPQVIKKSRNEALRGLGKRVNDDEEVNRKGPLSVGQGATRKSANKGDNPSKGMKTLDFFMQD